MTNESAPVVRLDTISKSFGAGEAPVLDGLSLTLQPGEVAGIVGASGCGKSTLLNVMGTLTRPDGGKVELFGEDATNQSEDALARLRAADVGFIFQMHHLLPQCSVLENVLVPSLALPKGQGGAEGRAEELLEKVGLGHRLGHFPSQLSGGERQRAAVVRALINRPRLVLADEPTGALDRRNAEALAELLAGLNGDEGVALALVTHDRPLADRMGRVYELREGKLWDA